MKITETCLYAENLDEAESFYSGVMGLKLIQKEEQRHLFYKCVYGMLLIFNPQRTRNVKTDVNESLVPLHGTEGAGHIAFTVNEDEYSNWKKRLTDHGIVIESEIVWSDDIRSFYFRDPAGNSLEIIRGDMWNLY